MRSGRRNYRNDHEAKTVCADRNTCKTSGLCRLAISDRREDGRVVKVIKLIRRWLYRKRRKIELNFTGVKIKKP